MTADIMSEAIALSSPSGRMSKRARKAAERRLQALCDAAAAEANADRPPPAPIVERIDQLRRHAARLRVLAARGMQPRAFIREAEQHEKLAAELEGTA